MKKNKKWIIGAILALFLSFSVLSLNVNAEEKEKEYTFEEKEEEIEYYKDYSKPYAQTKASNISNIQDIPVGSSIQFNGSLNYSAWPDNNYRYRLTNQYMGTSSTDLAPINTNRYNSGQSGASTNYNYYWFEFYIYMISSTTPGGVSIRGNNADTGNTTQTIRAYSSANSAFVWNIVDRTISISSTLYLYISDDNGTSWIIENDNVDFLAFLNNNATITPPQKTISFDSNGADSGTVPASTSVNAGTVYTLPGNTGNLVKAGYTFIGWNTSSNATTALTTYTVNANTTFYAVWQQVSSTYSISFNSNGADSGTVPASTSVNAGTVYTLPGNTGNLVKAGYTFIGWNTNPNYTTPLVQTTINANTTFYAVWQRSETATMPIQISVNNNLIYSGEMVVLNSDYYGWNISGFETGRLLELRFFNINYLAPNFKNENVILMDYTEHILFSFLAEDLQDFSIYIDGILSVDGTAEQWEEYFTEYYYMDMPFNAGHTILIVINTEETAISPLGSFKAIVANIVGGLETLFNLNFGWITLGGIISIVLTFSVVFFIFKLVRGGGGS